MSIHPIRTKADYRVALKSLIESSFAGLHATNEPKSAGITGLLGGAICGWFRTAGAASFIARALTTESCLRAEFQQTSSAPFHSWFTKP